MRPRRHALPDCLPDDRSVGEIYDRERSLWRAHRTDIVVPQDFSLPRVTNRVTLRRVRPARRTKALWRAGRWNCYESHRILIMQILLKTYNAFRHKVRGKREDEPVTSRILKS
jgi:hypothetical protein